MKLARVPPNVYQEEQQRCISHPYAKLMPWSFKLIYWSSRSLFVAARQMLGRLSLVGGGHDATMPFLRGAQSHDWPVGIPHAFNQ